VRQFVFHRKPMEIKGEMDFEVFSPPWNQENFFLTRRNLSDMLRQIIENFIYL